MSVSQAEEHVEQGEATPTLEIEQEDKDLDTDVGATDGYEGTNTAEEEEEEEEEEGQSTTEDETQGSDHERGIEDIFNTLQISPIALAKDDYLPDLSKLPESYKTNVGKELTAITYCKWFVLHYNHLCDRRNPLFLMPKNDCGVKKIVCTTIRPTQLPYRNLIDWQEIATFVAQYVIYDVLDSPTDLPPTLYAPQTVLRRRRGHCFDISTLLCSMLIGSGYDAFVVSGYASREVCTMDLTYTRCPLIDDDVKVYPKPVELNICRYTVRPPRQYNSEYQLRMKMKHNKAYKATMDGFQEKKEQMQRLLEAPPPDPLRGMRVHSWVMVLHGSRDIQKTFFIEPTTGFYHPTNWEEYLGIESLWNQFNYYVNMQEGEGNELPKSVAELGYDISDSRDWEYIFRGQGLHQPKMWLLKGRRHSGPDLITEEIPFSLPNSWTLPLKMGRDEYDERYPMGKTSCQFKKARVDFFTDFLMPNGLVKKLTTFYDIECTKVEYVLEQFAHRHDMLIKRFSHQQTGKTTETFSDGRDDFLKEHMYLSYTPGPESRRTLLFNSVQRLDQQYKREEGADFIKEWFRARPDRKIFEETRFGPTGRVFEEGEGPDSRPIEYIIARFSRNKSVPASEDIEEITFSVCTDEIDIIYHVEDERIVKSTRHFSKPDRWWDDTVYMDWRRELHWNFEANIYAKPKSELHLYELLVNLMKEEAHSRARTRRIEKETRKLLQTRNKEESLIKLITTYNDADRVVETRIARLKERARIREERMTKKMDIIRDYLEPYLQRLGLNHVTNKRQAGRIKDDVLEDLRGRFIYQMEAMKDAYERIKHEIEIMQENHCHEISSFPNYQLADYDCELVTKMFTAHILEERMNQLKVSTPVKYKALYRQIRNDPRIAQFL